MRTIPTGFLLLPPPTDSTFSRLRRKVRLLALRRLLSAPLGGLRPRLVELARRRSPVLLDALGSPDVLCALLVWEHGLRPPASLQSALVPDLLGALPPSALLEALQWNQPVSAVHLPRLGISVRFTPPARAMLVDPAGVVLGIDKRPIVSTYPAPGLVEQDPAGRHAAVGGG